MKNKYLSEEEQYKEILNMDEIHRIKDKKLRDIRLKYWNLKHEAFLDERGIPDSQIGKVHDELIRKEQAEMEEYRRLLRPEGQQND